jgi:hypothetical protein
LALRLAGAFRFVSPVPSSLEKIKIGNQEYEIRMVPDLKLEGDNVYGLAHPYDALIELEPVIDIELAEETYLHEVLETIKHTVCDIDWTEWQMDIIARAIVQINKQHNFRYFEKINE